MYGGTKQWDLLIKLINEQTLPELTYRVKLCLLLLQVTGYRDLLPKC